MKKGILLLGHGTRRQHGVMEFVRFFKAVCEQVQSRISHSQHEDTKVSAGGTYVMRYAFLELQEPTIVQAVEGFVAEGVVDIKAVPLFLFTAGHMKEDIPLLIEEALKANPDATVTLDASFGEDGVMMSVVRDRLRESPETELDRDTLLLVLGRGNKDVDAQAAFEDTARQIATYLDHPNACVAYLAGTGVPLEDVLLQAVRSGVRKIVIYPYLWFSGWLTDTLPERLASWQAVHPDAEIKVAIAPHLGLHPALIDAVAARVVMQ